MNLKELKFDRKLSKQIEALLSNFKDLHVGLQKHRQTVWEGL